MSMKKHVISNATVGVWKNMFWDHMMKWSVRKESLTIHTNFLIYASFNKKNRTATVTTGKRQFAVCPNVCRVQYIGHTANQLFVVCLHENTREIKNTRQTAMFAVCEDQAHGEHQVSPCAATLAHGETGARAMRVLLPSGAVLGLTDLYPMEEKGMSICKKRRRRRNYAIKCYYICLF